MNKLFEYIGVFFVHAIAISSVIQIFNLWRYFDDWYDHLAVLDWIFIIVFGLLTVSYWIF